MWDLRKMDAGPPCRGYGGPLAVDAVASDEKLISGCICPLAKRSLQTHIPEHWGETVG